MFWGGRLGRAKPRGFRGKKSLQIFEIYIPEIAASASNLATALYCALQRSEMVPEGGGGGGRRQWGMVDKQR